MEIIAKLNLDYPPSANRYWRLFRGRAVPSADATAYKLHVKKTALARGVNPTAETVALVVVLHPKMTKKGEASRTVIDLDNCLKVALDALQGIAYENDKQVRSIRLDYGEPVECGGLSISVHRHADSACKPSTDSG